MQGKSWGNFAPKFAQLNDDVLFREVWSREGNLSLRDRSVVTVVTCMAQGLTDSSLQYHLISAKNNGVTRTEITEGKLPAVFVIPCEHADCEPLIVAVG